jgi:RNA polymerase sigma-54 factor
MGMEMRQELRLSQQLVMTPQLQQAIRLLQLSRMELSELVHEEMLENPILEDDLDREMERDREREEVGGDDQLNVQMEGAGTTELAVDQPIGENNATSEVKGDDSRAVTEIDWENYLDGQSLSGGMSGLRADGDELPGVEATLTKETSLQDHLAWQLQDVRPAGRSGDGGRVCTIIGNIDATATSRTRRCEELAREPGVDAEYRGGDRARDDPDLRSGRRGRHARWPECLLIPGQVPPSARTTRSSSR